MIVLDIAIVFECYFSHFFAFSGNDSHSINNENPTQRGQGNTASRNRKHPHVVNRSVRGVTQSPAITSRHTLAPPPANSARIPAQFLTRRFPPTSGPFRAFPRMGQGMGQHAARRARDAADSPFFVDNKQKSARS